MLQELYTTGEYMEKNPTWHVEESPWKAEQVIRMMQQNQIVPQTICEVGCGAGEVLKQLQENMDQDCEFWGYDISPQAFELARSKANERLHFKLADIRQSRNTFFDLILILDVLEHIEDYFSFLRDMRPRSEYKIFHIPLDLSAQTIVRKNGLLKVREDYGHIHYFTKDIALQVLKEVGYNVFDYRYTARAVELPSKQVKRNLMRLPRKLLSAANIDLAARILGGWSLLVLAK